MIIDPLLGAALRHWGARAVPFSDQPGETPFLTPAWQGALELLGQTAALRSVMLLSGDNGVGKSALAAHWLSGLEPKAYLPLAITQATLSASWPDGRAARKNWATRPASFAAATWTAIEKALQRNGAPHAGAGA